MSQNTSWRLWRLVILVLSIIGIPHLGHGQFGTLEHPNDPELIRETGLDSCRYYARSEGSESKLEGALVYGDHGRVVEIRQYDQGVSIKYRYDSTGRVICSGQGELDMPSVFVWFKEFLDEEGATKTREVSGGDTSISVEHEYHDGSTTVSVTSYLSPNPKTKVRRYRTNDFSIKNIPALTNSGDTVELLEYREFNADSLLTRLKKFNGDFYYDGKVKYKKGKVYKLKIVSGRVIGGKAVRRAKTIKKYSYSKKGLLTSELIIYRNTKAQDASNTDPKNRRSKMWYTYQYY